MLFHKMRSQCSKINHLRLVAQKQEERNINISKSIKRDLYHTKTHLIVHAMGVSLEFSPQPKTFDTHAQEQYPPLLVPDGKAGRNRTFLDRLRQNGYRISDEEIKEREDYEAKFTEVSEHPALRHRKIGVNTHLNRLPGAGPPQHIKSLYALEKYALENPAEISCPVVLSRKNELILAAKNLLERMGDNMG